MERERERVKLSVSNVDERKGKNVSQSLIPKINGFHLP